MARKWGRRVTRGVHDGRDALRAGGGMGNAPDASLQLSVMDSRGHDAMFAVAYALAAYRFAKAELGAHGDLPQAFRLADHEAGRFILVNHDQRSAEPAGGVLNRLGLLGICDRMKAGARDK